MRTNPVKILSLLLCGWLLCALPSCMDYGPADAERFSFSDVAPGDGVFILGEGNFMYGNSSLSYYTPSTEVAENEVFIRANGMNLGDVAQSMVIHNGRGYIVVNNSSVVFIIDPADFGVTGTLGPFTSPRHIHFVSDDKAYVTDLRDPRIAVVDPSSRRITGYIDTRGHRSTEQMVQYGNHLFTNCWSYDNTVLVIDTSTDTVVDSIEVGLQPNSIALDRNGKIWVLADGGYTGSPAGTETPALYRVDAATRTVERTFLFGAGDSPRGLCIDGPGENIFFINRDVWKMDVEADALPAAPLIAHRGTIYYGLGVNPVNSEIYLGDAIDYMQPGLVYRYSPSGGLIGSFRVGINPGAFCFR